MFGPVLGHVQVDRMGPGAARTRPDAVLADKAYSSNAIREHLRTRGIEAVIPEREDQKQNRKRRGSAGGRPPKLNATKYRDRNVVERGFNRLKQWRALATRYDKLAVVYRAGVVLNGVVAWLEHLSDTT